jgi:hypothetical protein
VFRCLCEETRCVSSLNGRYLVRLRETGPGSSICFAVTAFQYAGYNCVAEASVMANQCPFCWTDVRSYPSLLCSRYFERRATGNPVDLGSRFALECVAGVLESGSIQVFTPMCANVRFCFLADNFGKFMLLPDECCVK